MARILKEEEIGSYINNRKDLHSQLSEIQADLEDFTNEELIFHRNDILERINTCMKLILESDEDNLD